VAISAARVDFRRSPSVFAAINIQAWRGQQNPQLCIQVAQGIGDWQVPQSGCSAPAPQGERVKQAVCRDRLQLHPQPGISIFDRSRACVARIVRGLRVSDRFIPYGTYVAVISYRLPVAGDEKDQSECCAHVVISGQNPPTIPPWVASLFRLPLVRKDRGVLGVTAGDPFALVARVKLLDCIGAGRVEQPDRVSAPLTSATARRFFPTNSATASMTSPLRRPGSATTAQAASE